MSPETDANRAKGEGGVEIKEGEEEELIVSLSALDKLWQGIEGGVIKEAQVNGTPLHNPGKDSDSAVLSPVDTVEQGGPGELRRSLEDVHKSVSEEVFCENR